MTNGKCFTAEDAEWLIDHQRLDLRRVRESAWRPQVSEQNNSDEEWELIARAAGTQVAQTLH
ncbi:MAG: hypothetical protein ABI596_10710 [Pyrinomonadaceae bacterium]